MIAMLLNTLLSSVLVAVVTASKSHVARQSSTNSTQLETDINTIQRQWGEITPYYDNAEDYFGVENIGLPDGCQVEQANLFQRHGARFPTGSFGGANDRQFGTKVTNWMSANSSQKFTGPLSFLNGYRYELGEQVLIGVGASQLFQNGVSFWQRYGRILYDQAIGQLAYNATYSNGTARPKPVLRTTAESRIENSEINWALGFFGTSYQVVPDPTLANATSNFDVVIFPNRNFVNDTLASYDSCNNSNNPVSGYLGDANLPNYTALYLASATSRLQQYVPSGFNLTTNDTYAMQDLCAYEYNYFGSSPFCSLFTSDEWQGFEHTHEIQYYYDYSWGNPSGRAQGIGYVQELLARLEDQYITSSNSSVNSTDDSSSATFPLNRPFYADFSHDDIIVSILTALSLDYFKGEPNVTQYPPSPTRPFILSRIVPFAANLITEVIGCNASNPAPNPVRRQYYTPTEYGYSPANASYKFIRMRLNNGILPLSSIRGGACAGRSDGMCALSDFLRSQSGSYQLSNYEYACFANYSGAVTMGEIRDWDGTINATYVASVMNQTTVG